MFAFKIKQLFFFLTKNGASVVLYFVYILEFFTNVAPSTGQSALTVCLRWIISTTMRPVSPESWLRLGLVLQTLHRLPLLYSSAMQWVSL